MLPMNYIDFSDWLEEELKKRGWQPAELARKAETYPATIARIINRERKPGPDICVGIARAFNMPAEDVFRKAGLLPSLPEGNVVVRTILLRLQELQTDRMGEEVYLPIILDFVETLSRRRQAAAAGDRLAKVTEELSALEFQDKQRRPFAIAERRRDAQQLRVPNHKNNGAVQTAEEKSPYETSEETQ